jgi:hypothetical protein
MKSPLLVLVFIVNLLTCPLRCMACESHTSAATESVCATCDCCSHCEEPSAPVDSVPHEQGCDCTNCVCEGAVVASPVELPLLNLRFCWLLSLNVGTASRNSLPFFTDGFGAGTFGLIYSGRDALIAHQSWQI